MTFHGRYADGRTVGIHMNGGDFDGEVDVSLDFFAGVDDMFCTVDRVQERFTLYTDEGAATYRIVGAGPFPASVHAVLEHVERPCAVCKLRGRNDHGAERHHWWCNRAA